MSLKPICVAVGNLSFWIQSVREGGKWPQWLWRWSEKAYPTYVVIPWHIFFLFPSFPFSVQVIGCHNLWLFGAKGSITENYTGHSSKWTPTLTRFLYEKKKNPINHWKWSLDHKRCSWIFSTCVSNSQSSCSVLDGVSRTVMHMILDMQTATPALSWQSHLYHNLPLQTSWLMHSGCSGKFRRPVIGPKRARFMYT